MALVIGIVIGVLIGAGFVYLWMSNSLAAKNRELEQAKHTIEDLERTRESRLRAATEALRHDFQRKLDARKTQEGEAAPQRTTTIQTNRQTTIQSPEEEPADSPSPKNQSPAEEPADSSSLEKQASEAPEAETPSSSPDPSEMPDRVPETPTRGTMVPMTDSTQPEISFVRSGLTDAQRDDLIRVVFNMGQSKQTSHLPELQRLSMFSSSKVRQAVAIAIGEIASANANVPAIRQTVPLLGKLSQDPDSTVRFAAIEGLGSIQSNRVIPYVRRALRDPDMKVVSAAKTVMDRFKYYPSTPSISKQNKKKKSYSSKSSES